VITVALSPVGILQWLLAIEVACLLFQIPWMLNAWAAPKLLRMIRSCSRAWSSGVSTRGEYAKRTVRGRVLSIGLPATTCGTGH
jgi:hypothetical protein